MTTYVRVIDEPIEFLEHTIFVLDARRTGVILGAHTF